MSHSKRTFSDSPAVRKSVPLLIGIHGPSGSGKTFSALRLATGIQKVTGGDIYVVDTEANRALHYADRFKFRHVPFGAPFSPLDYLAAFEHCVAKGAKVIVTDSLSHEHEGPGGVLEMHDAETTRLSEQWRQPREKVQMTAWQKPKSERRRLLNTMLQMPASFISCFRAKEKIKPVPGKQPDEQGWMPITDPDFIYEQTVHMFLPPGAAGVPDWRPDGTRAAQTLKLPEQFKQIFATKRALDEMHGELMARWAAGGTTADAPAKKPQSLNELLAAMGKDSLEAKSEWVGDKLGRPILSADELKALKPEEVSRLIELAKGEGT